MKTYKTTTNAVAILHQQFIGNDPKQQASLQEERVNAEVARTIYDFRTKAGLSQQELAQKIGTKQSVISRLEDSDYSGHSLTMLHRIAAALNRRLTIVMSLNDRTVARPVRVVRHSARRRPPRTKNGRISVAQ